MILRVWILCILLIVLWYFLSNREGFQNSGTYALPTPQPASTILSNFWSILNQQKVWIANGSRGSSGSSGGSGSQPLTTQQLLEAVTNPGPKDTFKVVFPNYISIYALAKYGMDPVAARYALTNNYDILQGELVTAVKTPAEISSESTFTSQPKQTACAELNALALSLYGQIIQMRATVSDLSGVAILSGSIHEENKNMQLSSACTNQGATPSRACIELASQDETLFPILHNYNAANVSLLTNGNTVQSMLNLVLQSYKGLECTLPSTPGSGPTITSVFSQDYINNIGIIDTQKMSEQLQELSPYYISPNLIGYISRQLISGGEFNTQLQTTADYINSMSKKTNAAVSLVNNLQGSRTYYDESGSGGIVVCPAGYYCPPTATYPIPCPVGYFCQAGTTALSNENKCPQGSYSLVGASDSSECRSSVPPGYYLVGSTLTKCEEGYYCPGGNSSRVPCPSGTYNGLKGQATSFGVCLPCPAGSYCCNKVGSICTPSAVAYPSPCPKGTFSATQNAISKSTCLKCPVGTVCSSIGMSSAKPCPAGTYSYRIGLSGECTPGPAGYYSMGTGLTNTSSFLQCSAGSYCPVGAGMQLSCPAGSYCDVRGLTAPKQCPAGRYGSSIGGTSAQCDGPCAAGSFCPAGSVSPTFGICPAGSYCPSGTPSPIPCTAGNYCPQGSPSPTPCPPGTYSAATGISSISQCAPCPGGNYCSAGTSTPVLCAIGTFCIGGNSPPGSTSSPPTPCTAGSYCDRAGMNIPTPCPRGTSSSTVGAMSMNTCVRCAPGLYNSFTGQTSCTGICQIGTYCPRSTQCYLYTQPNSGSSGSSVMSIPIGTVNPIQCPVGTYCDSASMSVPTPCPVGTYSSSIGATSVATCQPCVPGTYCPTIGQGSSVLCPAGTYCPGGGSAPLQCPVGKMCPNPGLGSALGCPAGQYGSTVEGATSCTDCPAGTYSPTSGGVGLSSCTTCPIGTYCPGGGSATIQCPAGTICIRPGMGSALGCPAGQYGTTVAGVTSCTDCPAGTYSPTSGGVNVSSCTTCPAGTRCPTPGMTAATPCRAGTYSDVTGFTGICTQCGFGTYSLSGSTQCTICPAGTYGSSAENTSAACSGPCYTGYTCAAGSVDGYGNLIGTTVAPTTNCLGGYFCPLGRGQVSVQCTAGYFCPVQRNAFNMYGSIRPIISPAGSYSLAGSSTYIACPQGTYSNSSTKPINPTTGLITPSVPVSSVSNPNISASAQTGYQCQPCPAGTTTNVQVTTVVLFGLSQSGTIAATSITQCA